ncbi:vanillyl-alcohol oxidase [Colletotrichum higginsianum]|nr:vanillyl-alcohol oxidase [Colletotrichum higginsianum]
MAPIPEPIVLPPNFTPELFERLILGAQEICGAENVRVVPKGGPRRRRPRACPAPSSSTTWATT